MPTRTNWSGVPVYLFMFCCWYRDWHEYCLCLHLHCHIGHGHSDVTQRTRQPLSCHGGINCWLACIGMCWCYRSCRMSECSCLDLNYGWTVCLRCRKKIDEIGWFGIRDLQRNFWKFYTWSYSESRQVFQSFENFKFLISISLNLYFYFD